MSNRLFYTRLQSLFHWVYLKIQLISKEKCAEACCDAGKTCIQAVTDYQPPENF